MEDSRQIYPIKVYNISQINYYDFLESSSHQNVTTVTGSMLSSLAARSNLSSNRNEFLN